MICPNCYKEIKDSLNVCPFCSRNIREVVETNWKAQIEQVVLGYDEHKGLVHGLQKDAIQNGWGHRLSKKGKDWSFEFNLFKGFDKKYLLTMTDIGGFGLTGENMETREIPDNLSENERLARFEHMYFSGGNTQGAGLFGRGKLLFTAASKDYHIIYDSLTHDGYYRLNERILEGRRFSNFAKAFEDEDANGMLGKLTRNCVKPLNKSGTRIIIVNPLDEVVNAILDRSFLKYIEETWWQILLKFSSNGAKIIIKTEKGTQEVRCPKEFKDETIKKWKSKPYDLSFDYGGHNLKIKKLHFIVSPEPVPPEIRGLYLYRREMKIADLELRDIPEEIADRFYGYVEIEKDSALEKIYLDERIEGPEHYSINKNKGLIRKLRKELQIKFDGFKRELGFGIDSVKISKEKTRRAMTEALNELNKRMGELGISIGKISKHKDISISLESIHFPREGNFVEIGDNIEQIRFKIRNKSILMEHKLRITVSTKEFRGEIIDNLFEQPIILKKEEQKVIGPFSFKISPDKYPREGEISCICTVKDESVDKTLAQKIIPIFIGITPLPQDTPIVDLILDSVNFPRGRDNKRVNYGESVNNIIYGVTNNTPEKIKVKFKAKVLNALVKSQEIEILNGEGIDLVLEPFGEGEVRCSDIDVTQEKYSVLDREKGPVVLRSTIIALEPSNKVKEAINTLELKNARKATPQERKDIVTALNSFDKGDKLAKNDLKFWVNMDSGKGVFEDYRSWDGGATEPRSKIQTEGEGFVCLLNETHPAYENLLENGDDSAIQSYTYEQLLRQTLILLIRKDVLEYWPEIAGKRYKENIEDAESEIYEKIEACQNTLDYLYADYLK